MSSVRLIHWNEKEARGRAEKIQAAGYDVNWEVPKALSFLRELGERVPVAVVIDLSRLPAQGRDMGLAIRHQKRTRAIPLVFVGGEPEKVARAKASVPDAVYTQWGKIRSALKKAITNPPLDPVVPKSMLAGYSGTPLPKKLGIKPRSVVALLHAPKNFEQVLGRMPEGVKVKQAHNSDCDLTLWFAKSQVEINREVRRLAKAIGDGKIWIAWPKKASRVPTDLTQQFVREAGLAAGLVDFKICAIDDTWSALLFTRRKQQVKL